VPSYRGSESALWYHLTEALSQHFGAILQEGILDRKNILQEQAKEAFCTKQVARANKKTYLNNKFWYDRKAKQRKFEVNDLVYLYNPAMKPGLSRKFRKPWTGLYKITKKISDVNYEIMDQNNKSQVVHVNRLKDAHNTDLWKPKQHRNATKKTREKVKRHLDEEEEDEFRIGSLPMQIPNYTDRTESETPLVQTPNTPDPVQQMVENPFLEKE